MMANSNANIWEIPPIGSDQIWINSQKIIKENIKPDVAMFDNAPNDVSIWSFFGKVLIWCIVWVCVAALLIGTFSLWWLIWWFSAEEWVANSLLWVLLPVMWFIACFVWNLALAWLYNIFFSKRYYNFSKMFWLIFVSSILTLPLFIIIFAIYWFFKSANMETLYFIWKFQIIFSLFISLNLVDFLSQPNYSASSLMWNTLWCALAIVIALFIKWDNIIDITLSAVITYSCTVFWAAIRDAIYYKFYEWWNNPFYLPSLNELREERKKEEVKKKEEEEEVNVDVK